MKNKKVNFNGKSYDCMFTETNQVYVYGITFNNHRKYTGLIISSEAVILSWHSGQCTRTNICPRKIFSTETLDDDQLGHIIELVENIGYEGKVFTKSQVDKSIGENK